MVFRSFSGRTGSGTHSFTYGRTDSITECLRYRFSTMTEAYKSLEVYNASTDQFDLICGSLVWG